MYSYKKQTKLNFEESVRKVKEELKKEGFGILTEADVKATLKKKLNVDFENYVILGACNPPFAHKALLTEIEIGLLLPCNVIVYQQNEEVFVSTILPTIAMNVVKKPEMKKIAEEVEIRLKKVIDAV